MAPLPTSATEKGNPNYGREQGIATGAGTVGGVQAPQPGVILGTTPISPSGQAGATTDQTFGPGSPNIRVTGAPASTPTPAPAPAPLKAAAVGPYAAAAAGQNADAAAAGLSSGQGYGGAPGTDAGGGGNPYQPPTADAVYADFLARNQNVIDSIQQPFDAQIAANTNSANQESADAQQGSAAAAAASGLMGSSAATAGATKTSTDIGLGLSKENTALVQQRATAVAGALQQIQTEAQSAYQFERTQSATDRTDLQSRATNIIKGLATAHVNFDTFSKDPQYASSYQQLVQMVGGDPNALNALWTLNTPPANVVKSWTDGSKYYQMIQDPITGKPQVQSFDMPPGTSIPQDWTFQKIGTNSGRFVAANYNPADPSTYKDVYVDPFTGAVTDGSAPANSDSTGTASSTDSSAARNVQTALGGQVDMSQPLSAAVATYGADRIAQAMVQNEGGSPAGVANNPGNIKFTGAPGQADSGVKATDGGTFASYSTPEAGMSAISGIINNAASGTSGAYGAQPTLAGFVGKYTNTGTPQPNPAQYGLLAGVSGFDPANDVDSAASNYLNEYLYQGKTPTAASVGVSTRAGSGLLFNKIADRAGALYTAATGQPLPDQNILAGNKQLITGNNSIINNLNLQEETISKNSDLLLNNLDGSNLNQNAPLINGVIDSISQSLGSVDTAALLAQSATIKNELGSLLALKNASGTTVHDKLEAAGLIDSSYSADQIASVVKNLMKEAQNGRAAITISNAKLYQQIDPLQHDQQNPLTNPQEFMSSVGYDLSSVKADNPTLTDQEIVTQFLNSQ